MYYSSAPNRKKILRWKSFTWSEVRKYLQNSKFREIYKIGLVNSCDVVSLKIPESRKEKMKIRKTDRNKIADVK